MISKIFNLQSVMVVLYAIFIFILSPFIVFISPILVFLCITNFIGNIYRASDRNILQCVKFLRFGFYHYCYVISIIPIMAPVLWGYFRNHSMTVFTTPSPRRERDSLTSIKHAIFADSVDMTSAKDSASIQSYIKSKGRVNFFINRIRGAYSDNNIKLKTMNGDNKNWIISVVSYCLFWTSLLSVVSNALIDTVLFPFKWPRHRNSVTFYEDTYILPPAKKNIPFEREIYQRFISANAQLVARHRVSSPQSSFLPQPLRVESYLDVYPFCGYDDHTTSAMNNSVDPSLGSADSLKGCSSDNILRPVIILLYGDAWMGTGSAKWQYWALANILREKCRAVVVVPDYPIYPKGCIQEMSETIGRAIIWVNDNAAKYGGSNQHIWVLGHSSGAHLAAYTILRSMMAKASNSNVLPYDLVAGCYNGNNHDDNDSNSDKDDFVSKGSVVSDGFLDEPIDFLKGCGIFRSRKNKSATNPSRKYKKGRDMSNLEYGGTIAYQGTGSHYIISPDVQPKRKYSSLFTGDEIDNSVVINEQPHPSHPRVDYRAVSCPRGVILFSGVYDLHSHLLHERSQGIHNVSSMTGATRGFWSALSPNRLIDGIIRDPRMFPITTAMCPSQGFYLIHSNDDHMVPVSQSIDFQLKLQNLSSLIMRNKKNTTSHMTSNSYPQTLSGFPATGSYMCTLHRPPYKRLCLFGLVNIPSCHHEVVIDPVRAAARGGEAQYHTTVSAVLAAMYGSESMSKC